MKHSQFAGDAEVGVTGGASLLAEIKTLAEELIPKDASYVRVNMRHNSSLDGYTEIFSFKFDYYFIKNEETDKKEGEK